MMVTTTGPGRGVASWANAGLAPARNTPARRTAIERFMTLSFCGDISLSTRSLWRRGTRFTIRQQPDPGVGLALDLRLRRSREADLRLLDDAPARPKCRIMKEATGGQG